MQFERILDKFSGQVPLFPLPKVVLFPGARLPLHVFEPRYRHLVRDAQEGEGLIGMVCVREKAGQTELGQIDLGQSPIFPVACLGQMRNVQQLPDGRFLMHLSGIHRIRIREELSTSKPYRLARVDLMPDLVNPLEPQQPESLFQHCLELFNQILRNLADLPGSLVSIQKEVPIGLLLDVLAYYLPVEAVVKQRLLEEVEVHQRGRLLTRILTELSQVNPESEGIRFRIFPRPSSN